MSLSESVKFFGAYGTLPPTRDKTIVQRKLFFLGLVALVALSLQGCFTGIETKSGWHMLSLPPSTGKRLAAECSMARTVKGMEDNISKGLREYETSKLLKEIQSKQDKQFKNIIRDLEVENAALRASNKRLLDLDYARK